jgi:hypothetical protein
MAFIRPDRFVFESRDKSGDDFGYYHYIVWRREQQVQTWWSGRPGTGIDTPPLLLMGLSGARYIVGDPAVRVPALLLPNEFREAPAPIIAMVPELLIQVKEPKRLEDVTLGDVICFSIEGRRTMGAGGVTMGTETLWVDKKTFLVRRSVFKFGNVEGTIAYDPIVDESVTETMLTFNPPTRR